MPARTNPNTNVFVLFASPVGFVKNETESRILDAILSYENVHLRNLNLWSYVKDTPLDEFFHTNKLFKSDYLVSHLSDFLRYLRYTFNYSLIIRYLLEDFLFLSFFLVIKVYSNGVVHILTWM